MRWNGNRSGDWTEVARRGVGPLTVALREAQKRGEVAAACEPEVVAHFVVASLKGALLVTKLTKDAKNTELYLVHREVSNCDEAQSIAGTRTAGRFSRIAHHLLQCPP